MHSTETSQHLFTTRRENDGHLKESRRKNLKYFIRNQDVYFRASFFCSLVTVHAADSLHITETIEMFR